MALAPLFMDTFLEFQLTLTSKVGVKFYIRALKPMKERFIQTIVFSSKIDKNWTQVQTVWTKGVFMRTFDYGKLADKTWDMA